MKLSDTFTKENMLITEMRDWFVENDDGTVLEMSKDQYWAYDELLQIGHRIPATFMGRNIWINYGDKKIQAGKWSVEDWIT